jgi:hypothetical protein
MASPQQRAESFLTTRADRKPIPVTAATIEEGAGVAVLGAAEVDEADFPFSNFIHSHQVEANRVAAAMMTMANEDSSDAGLEKILDFAEEEALRTSNELVKFALLVFITHHPAGQRLPAPPLEERDPQKVKPSHPPLVVTEGVAVLGALGKEGKLDWYREDIGANDHHTRWHVVYNGGGVPNPANPSQLIPKDRHGELFLYMHQQMLARYDAERLGVELAAAKPISTFTGPIAEGYQPNLEDFTDRAANAPMGTATNTARLTAASKAITNELRNNNGAAFKIAGRRFEDVLGTALEAAFGSPSQQTFGSLHNSGHGRIASIDDPAGNPGQGVMGFTDTAIRDPVFYRWHRFIDDLFVTEWQEKQPAQNFGDAPAGISLRDETGGGHTKSGASPDVIVVRAADVIGDPQLFGEQKFGGENWAKDPDQSGVAHGKLETRMKNRVVDGDPVEELDHDDFFTFFRVDNSAAAAKKVTFRVFLAAEKFFENRRQWIEMDKFEFTLPANAKSVVARSSKLSSVARKPARRPGDPPPAPEPGADPNYCDCGWPYHLLLPRSTKTGGKYQVFVMLTDHTKDNVGPDSKCGSMSFCGKKDKYPDDRPMGYPFSFKWPDKIAKIILAQENMAARDITITWK